MDVGEVDKYYPLGGPEGANLLSRVAGSGKFYGIERFEPFPEGDQILLDSGISVTA